MMGWNGNVSKGKKISRQASGMCEEITRNEGKWSWGRLWKTARGSKSLPWLCCGPKFGLLEWRGQLGKEEMTLLFSNRRECGMGQELPPSSIPSYHLSSIFLSFPSSVSCLSISVSSFFKWDMLVLACALKKMNQSTTGNWLMWETESPRSAAAKR